MYERSSRNMSILKNQSSWGYVNLYEHVSPSVEIYISSMLIAELLSANDFHLMLYAYCRFQKTYQALEQEGQAEKKQLVALHQQRVQAEPERAQTSRSCEHYMTDALQKPTPDVRKLSYWGHERPPETYSWCTQLYSGFYKLPDSDWDTNSGVEFQIQ